MITLERYGSTPQGTFGVLKYRNLVFHTIERPWLDNKPMVSCVPCGTYALLWKPTTTAIPLFFDDHTWYLEGGTVSYNHRVDKQRYRVALHIANSYKDVAGCIGLGSDLGVVHGNWAVTSSRSSLAALYRELGPNDSTLKITQLPCG